MGLGVAAQDRRVYRVRSASGVSDFTEMPRTQSSSAGLASGRAEIGGEQARVDAGALEGGGPARIDVALVEQMVVPRRREPAVAAQLLLELAGAPAGIAQSGDPARRPP